MLGRDPNTIFRGNTLVSKCMDELMKLAGLHYLHTVLRPVVERIYQERRPCEVRYRYKCGPGLACLTWDSSIVFRR